MVPTARITNNNKRRSWRSSDLEETFTIPGAMVCPLHGGRYVDRRRAPPPPPPQLAAAARRRCRCSRNAAVSQFHDRHRATRDDSPEACRSASETLAYDCYYFTDDRPFPLGYGWVEPGKGWTRNHRPTSGRAPPKTEKKPATLGKDTSRDWFNVPSARDAAWAMSYLSREDELPGQQKVRRNAAREYAGSRGCHDAAKMVPPRGYSSSNSSTAPRRPNAACLAETHIMRHVSCWDWFGVKKLNLRG